MSKVEFITSLHAFFLTIFNADTLSSGVPKYTNFFNTSFEIFARTLIISFLRIIIVRITLSRVKRNIRNLINWEVAGVLSVLIISTTWVVNLPNEQRDLLLGVVDREDEGGVNIDLLEAQTSSHLETCSGSSCGLTSLFIDNDLGFVDDVRDKQWSIRQLTEVCSVSEDIIDSHLLTSSHQTGGEFSFKFWHLEHGGLRLSLSSKLFY